MKKSKNLLPFLVLLFAAGFCSVSLHASAKKKTTAQVLAPTSSEQRWKYQNKTTFNAIVLTGNSETITLGGTEKFTAKKERLTDIFTAGVTYAREDVFNTLPAKTTSRDIFVKDKLLWEFYPRTYSYLGGGWLTNRTSGIDHQFDGFTGLGYKLLALADQTLSLDTGYRLESRDRVAPFADEGVTHNAAFGINYRWQITDKASLENETDHFFDVTDPGTTRISSFTELEVEIVKHLSLSLGFRLQFDNNPVPTFKKLNTTSTTGIVFLF